MLELSRLSKPNPYLGTYGDVLICLSHESDPSHTRHAPNSRLPKSAKERGADESTPHLLLLLAGTCPPYLLDAVVARCGDWCAYCVGWCVCRVRGRRCACVVCGDVRAHWDAPRCRLAVLPPLRWWLSASPGRELMTSCLCVVVRACVLWACVCAFAGADVYACVGGEPRHHRVRAMQVFEHEAALVSSR